MPPAPPKIGFVSLGCPKALVDSERILSQLRAEGYEIGGELRRRRRRRREHLRLPRQRERGVARRDRRGARGERARDRDGLPRRRARAIRAAHPNVIAITGPHQYEAVVSAVHDAVPPQHDPLRRSRAAAGREAHAAALRLSENLRGLQPPLQLLHHPAPARRSREPPRSATCCARPSGSCARA